MEDRDLKHYSASEYIRLYHLRSCLEYSRLRDEAGCIISSPGVCPPSDGIEFNMPLRLLPRH